MQNRMTLNLPCDFVEEATHCAIDNCRSVPDQIEYWAKLGQLVESHPDLSLEFVKHLLAEQEVAHS